MKSYPNTSQQIGKAAIIALGVATIVFLLLRYVEFFAGLNDLLLDEVMVHANHPQPDQRLMVIEINDESVRQLGKPIPRSNYVKLLRKLPPLGIKTTAFDLLFIDEELPENDACLAAWSDSVKHVIHCFKFSDDAPDSDFFAVKHYEKYAVSLQDQSALTIMTARSAVYPHPKFIDHFHQAGHITVEWDYDGRSRRMPLFYQFNGRIYPALGLVALFDYLGVVNRTIKIQNSFWGRKAIIELTDSCLEIPIDDHGQMLLNFYGIFKVFQPIPLHHIVSLLDAFQPRQSLYGTLPLYDGKLVLIGNTETGMDKYETPFSAEFPGVGFHATFISNILQRNFIREASEQANVIMLAILAVFLLTVFFYHNTVSRSFWTFYLFPIGLLVIFNVMAYLVFYRIFDIWLNVIQINGCCGTLMIVLFFYEKVARVKELSTKIAKLNQEICEKNAKLDKLNQQIHAQGEQYKTIEYFVKGLQSTFVDPTVNVEQELKKFFPGFFEQYERMRISLDEKIMQLNAERDRVAREKQLLEQERTIYQGILKGAQPETTQPPVLSTKANHKAVAQQALSAWQYFRALQKKGSQLPQPIPGIIALPAIVDENNQKVKTPMGEIIEKIALLSQYDSTVLITGEVGVGKELVARAIHEQSHRANKRLVIINCATLPEHLMESELFGHKKGSFTDAKYDHKGAFEYADGGTIFLDEIGELKLDVQAKLLRVLQNREIQKVGSNEPITVDVRVIAATNRDLKGAIERHEFRSDLYSRLQVVDLHIPALRYRKYDIPFLAQHFLNRFNSKYGKAKSCSSETIIAMLCYDWPNNIRQLEHVIEKACVLTSGDEIGLSALPEEIQNAYRDIFESEQVPWWSQIEVLLHQEQQRLLLGCKNALRSGRIQEFLHSTALQADHRICSNCYEYLMTFINGIASIFAPERREALVRRTIIQMQEELLHWCHQEKIDKLSRLYKKIEQLLGRSRRQIDNWRRQ